LALSLSLIEEEEEEEEEECSYLRRMKEEVGEICCSRNIVSVMK
jgi:hypothetical protein